MDRELRRRAEEVFHAALELEPEARGALVAEACRGDAALRSLVDGLLSADRGGDDSLETQVQASRVEPDHSLVGRQWGAFRIVSRLGAGGMGEVYRAHDGKLGRDVAIKVLPPEFAGDARRLARFRREARALAALNHPNIAAIYGLEDSGGLDCLVLELVEGETLRGPVPVDTAIDLACQVADALDAAHAHGIVHRDLKPANIKVTPQGAVKVLDFGLAKAGPAADEEVAGAASTVMTGEATAAGQVLGTPGYMSPEQARGLPVDQRTDVWAFGCVLYELLTGTRAFPGANAVDAIGAVLEREPDWRALPAGTPAKLRRLLRQCLEKEAARRLASVAVAREALRGLRPGRGSRAAHASARAGARPRIQALVVLPLVNLSHDPEQDYFSDGMTEALTAELAQLHALRVISRTSAVHYKGTTKTASQIGRELGVDALIEGSVLRADDRVRITAQLVHAGTDRHLWAHSYDRDLRDVLALQREVAQAIADEIQVTVTPRERAARLRPTPTPVSVASHEAYLRGRYCWGRMQPQKSIDFYRQAIGLDRNNALAYAGIGDSLCMLFGAAIQRLAPMEAAPEARSAALAAIALDETLAEPHVTLARVLFWHDRDAAGAERELRRAIQVNPNCAMAHFHTGMLHADFGRKEASIVSFRRALQLDPLSCWNTSLTGLLVYYLGEKEEGVEQLRRAQELDPGAHLPWMCLGMVHAHEGDLAAAEGEIREGLRLSSGLPLARGWASYVLGRAGRREESTALLEELLALRSEVYVPAFAVAWCYLGLGDTEKVFDWLDIAFEQRDSGLPHIAAFREFDTLASDPRFQRLLARLGLSGAAELPAGEGAVGLERVPPDGGRTDRARRP